ncbi:hypothetical protein LPB41_00830 [Thalassospira sp. MA62]|nr:hypothetical protein [Thalassospira sp. MA62]
MIPFDNVSGGWFSAILTPPDGFSSGGFFLDVGGMIPTCQRRGILKNINDIASETVDQTNDDQLNGTPATVGRVEIAGSARIYPPKRAMQQGQKT